MKPKTVKTTTDFVLWLLSKKSARLWDEIWKLHDVDKDNFNHISRVVIHNYAKLMQTPLSLEMFVPCNNKGEIMNRLPARLPQHAHEPESELGKQYEKEYQQAKENVLFEGWEYYSIIHKTVYIKHKRFGKFEFINSELIAVQELYYLPLNIEDLARQIELIPNDNFWKKIRL